MDILDLFDREAARLATDFWRCAVARGDERDRLAGALLRRVAALILAVDQAVLPTLAILDAGLVAKLMLGHGRLKARVAVALSSSRVDTALAWRALCRTRSALGRCGALVRTSLRPALCEATTPGERRLVGEQVTRWLQNNRRQPRESRPRADSSAPCPSARRRRRARPEPTNPEPIHHV